MANVLAELFQNTANAIREKTGETGTMKPAEFPDKIRSIESGGGGTGTPQAELLSLSVTRNGVYYPTEMLETGKTYTLGNDFTQEELQSFYNASLYGSEDGMFAFLLSPSDAGESVTLGVMYYQGVYGLYISDGHIWLPEEFSSQMGLSAGWNFGSDLTDLTPTEIPTVTIEDDFILYLGGSLSVLNPLFVLNEFDGFSVVGVNVKPNLEELTVTENGTYEPSETDGFSKVTVNVPTGSGSSGERNIVVTSGEYIPTSENEIVTVTHNLGYVPDMIIIRITGQLPTVTPILTVFCGTFFSKNMVSPSEITGYYQLFGSNSGKLSSGTGKNDFRESSDHNFVNEVNGQTFKLGSEFARHLVGVTYNWTAFGNVL